MAKSSATYVCQECTAEQTKWSGRCPNCGAWNTLEEVRVTTGKIAAAERLVVQPVTDVTASEVDRLPTGSAEFDRVLGGGIVPGSIMLLGGEPGIGKSTVLLQLAGRLATDGPVLYVSGEESAEQIALRARRLGVEDSGLLLVSATDIDRIVQTILAEKPRLVIIDSIQTVQTTGASSGPGSVTQVRESASRLQIVAKSHHVPVIVVGHVTKEGSLAGPKVLEHVVDTVLYLEGEKYHGYRLLRGAKNRFGATDEVGVFTMTEQGLVDETNPTGAFINTDVLGNPGTVVTASLEGTRVLLAEVQALGVETAFGYPKRTASGYDVNKLHLVIAVLIKHGRLPLGSTDLYCNVSSGFRLVEPAGDLAVAMAVASAVRQMPLPADTMVCGEIGLAGEVRPVMALGKRLEEAARAGLKQAIVPDQSVKAPAGFKVIKVKRVADAIAHVKRPVAEEAHAA